MAKLSLWLASFVPGLSLAYLGRNVVVGNSLVGVARPEALRVTHPDQPGMLDEAVSAALAAAGEAALRVAEGEDRTPEEVSASEAADAEAHHAVAGLQRLFDLWTAEPFGVAGGRQEAELHGAAIIEGRTNRLVDAAEEKGERHRFLHWPLAFPRVFSRSQPGFDAVVGNPPWEEVTVEALAFYGLYRPDLRGLPEAARAAAIDQLVAERPELPVLLAEAQAEAATVRRYVGAGEYQAMPSDPDLYKLFCQRYRAVLRDGGALGVVLPRSTFVTDGSEGFRRWRFEETTCRRTDFLINRRLWMFDTHPQYGVALVAAERRAPSADHEVRVAGPADSLPAWEAQVASPGIALRREAFGPGWATPLIGTQAEADLLAKVRVGHAFPHGPAGRWRCLPVRELDETNDRRLWQGASSGRPLWKGESFDGYDPHGAGARPCPDTEAVRQKVTKLRPGSGSILAAEIPVAVRRRAVADQIDPARVAFRDVSRSNDSRTVRACLVPPGVFLTNKAPYLAFAAGDDRERAACLAIMDSLPFDWQARRFVEINLNFFILEGLVVPDLGDEDFEAVAECSARLSCVDDRYADFAGSFGIEPGPLPEEERRRLRVEIDARVARSWSLSAGELDLVLGDFTAGAVPAAYRQALRRRLAELSVLSDKP